MDINKEREAFETWWESFHNGRQIACDYVEEDNSYSVGYANAQWVAWQAKAQAVPEWISMEDKYPKAGESVLICINGIRQNVAYFYDCSVSNEYSDRDWFEPVFTGGEAGDECVVKTEDVTHWMLLPKELAK